MQSPRLRMRNVVLTAKAEPVRISTAVPTTLTFDAPIDTQSVRLADSTAVELLAVGGRSITLRAVASVTEPVALRLRLQGPSTQAAPVFLLTSAEDVVDAQVMVFHEANALALLQARVEELEARCAACEAALAERREQGAMKGPADWVLSQQIEQRGVRVARFSVPPSSDRLDVVSEGGLRFLANTWLVFKAGVRSDIGLSWRPGRAWLENAVTGQRVAARAVRFALEAHPHGAAGRVVVEFGWVEKMGDSATYRLVIEAAGAGASLVIPGVTLQDGTPVGE
ncbi:DUF2381 family protein [Myxococcus sp. SDU36]|nr:DUF2381 family protein [Myxococcus sp. SDU36]